MTKTRVLLAFGRYGNAGGRAMGPMIGNTRFLQKAAREFAWGYEPMIILILLVLGLG